MLSWPIGIESDLSGGSMSLYDNDLKLFESGKTQEVEVASGTSPTWAMSAWTGCWVANRSNVAGGADLVNGVYDPDTSAYSWRGGPGVLRKCVQQFPG